MPDSSERAVVGVDLGGTTIKAALVSEQLHVLAHELVPTERKRQELLLDAIAELVESVRGERQVEAVGFGLPSQIDQRHGRILDSTNVPLESLDFADEMRARVGCRVVIDNDANVACLAECRAGAGRGASHVVMLTLGTGVGGGLLLNGRIYRGSFGAGAELGHMVVDQDGPRCQGHCPNRGCLEIMASATGLLSAARRIARQRPQGQLAAEARDELRLSPRLVIEQALAGDPDARDAVTIVGRYLGVGISSFVNIFSPELVIVGGGLVALGELLLEPARAEMHARALPSLGRSVEVVPAALGNEAGVIGAAALTLEPDPAEAAGAAL